jgi:hypothetical protein
MVLVPSLLDFMDNFIIIMFIWCHILKNVHQWPFFYNFEIFYEWFLFRKHECKKINDIIMIETWNVWLTKV